MAFITFKEAIARQEGFNIPGSRSNRNNNPGNINYGTFAEAHGATRIEIPRPGVVARFAYFPTPTIGYAAMSALLKASYLGKSVAQVIAKYAPPSDGNDDGAYVKNICAWTGLTSDTILTENLLN